MSFHKKEIISEKTLLTWIFYSVISTIACLLITAFVVYLKYDCWIMYQHQLAGGSCSPDLNQLLVFSIPAGLGLVIGTVLALKAGKDDGAE